MPTQKDPTPDIDPMKRIAVVLFNVESAFKEARVAAAAKNQEKVYSNLEIAFELLNPLLSSLTILEESQKRTLVEKLLGAPQN